MDLGNELVFIGTGFGLVLSVLALLWLVSWILGLIFAHKPAAKPAAAAPAPAAPAAATAAPSGQIPPHHLAAISAAVAALTDGKGRITNVSLPAHRVPAWAQEGRIEHFSSHRVRSDWAIPGPPHVEHEPAKRS